MEFLFLILELNLLLLDYAFHSTEIILIDA